VSKAIELFADRLRSDFASEESTVTATVSKRRLWKKG
jgi:hypothetical protein